MMDPQSVSYFDNVKMTFMINNRTDKDAIMKRPLYQDVTCQSKSIIENVVDKSIVLDMCR